MTSAKPGPWYPTTNQGEFSVVLLRMRKYFERTVRRGQGYRTDYDPQHELFSQGYVHAHIDSGNGTAAILSKLHWNCKGSAMSVLVESEGREQESLVVVRQSTACDCAFRSQHCH